MSLDWCHNVWSKLEHPEKAWAVGVLRGYVTKGDECPEWITRHE